MGISPNTIVHVGAHTGEERSSYLSKHWKDLSKIIWIEAQPSLAQKLSEIVNPEIETVLNHAVWSKTGEVLSLKVTNNSESSSLLKLADHSILYPDISVVTEIEVHTVRLDELIPCDFHSDFLNLDIQGAELAALQGLGTVISDFNVIYTEVNFIELYEDCPLVEDLDSYLKQFGFDRISTRTVPDSSWGDAIYVRQPKILTRARSQILRISTCIKNLAHRYRVLRSKINFRSNFRRISF
jgi:FkbM family methyltransferase